MVKHCFNVRLYVSSFACFYGFCPVVFIFIFYSFYATFSYFFVVLFYFWTDLGFPVLITIVQFFLVTKVNQVSKSLSVNLYTVEDSQSQAFRQASVPCFPEGEATLSFLLLSNAPI